MKEDLKGAKKMNSINTFVSLFVPKVIILCKSPAMSKFSNSEILHIYKHDGWLTVVLLQNDFPTLFCNKMNEFGS